jgi:hypothetical protein
MHGLLTGLKKLERAQNTIRLCFSKQAAEELPSPKAYNKHVLGDLALICSLSMTKPAPIAPAIERNAFCCDGQALSSWGGHMNAPELLHKHSIRHCAVGEKHPLRRPGTAFRGGVARPAILVRDVQQQCTRLEQPAIVCRIVGFGQAECSKSVMHLNAV